MKKQPILIGSLLVIVLLAPMLAGCAATPPAPAPTTAPAQAAQPAASEEKVTITFVNWIGAEDATKPAVEAMLNGFMAKYPNITVESVPIAFNQNKDQLIVMSTGGNAPDISMVHTTWVAPLVDAGVLAPLNDLLLNKDDYYPASLDGKTYNGNLMAVTWAPSPIIAYYSKSLLAQAGYNDPPKTWDEMLKMAADVAKLGKDANGNQLYGFGISSKKLAGAGYFALPFLGVYGVRFQDENGQITLDSPGSVEAFTAMKELFVTQVTPEGLEIRDLRNLFANEQIAFHFDIEAGRAIFRGLSPKKEGFDNDYGMILLPSREAGKPAESLLIEHTLAIYKDSKHPKEAALLLDYLTGPEGMALYNEKSGPKLPGRASTAEIGYYSLPENAFTKLFIDAIGASKPMPATNSAFLSAMEEVAVAIQRVGITKEDPALVVKELDAAVKSLYKQ